MLSVEIALPDVEELHKLVEQGQEKGFLTYDEIVASLEDVDLNKEQVEDGTQRALRPALAELLPRLGYAAGDMADVSLVNSLGEIVGVLRVV